MVEFDTSHIVVGDLGSIGTESQGTLLPCPWLPSAMPWTGSACATPAYMRHGRASSARVRRCRTDA